MKWRIYRLETVFSFTFSFMCAVCCVIHAILHIHYPVMHFMWMIRFSHSFQFNFFHIISFFFPISTLDKILWRNSGGFVFNFSGRVRFSKSYRLQPLCIAWCIVCMWYLLWILYWFCFAIACQYDGVRPISYMITTPYTIQHMTRSKYAFILWSLEIYGRRRTTVHE